MSNITVYLLMIGQQAINRLKPLYDRFIIRDILSHGKELPATSWFTLAYWKALSLPQLIGVLSLAGFTAITFPLGVWVGSFSLVITYPFSHILGNLAALLIHPIMLFVANKGLNEFVVNKTTMTGFSIVMVSLVCGAIGWYMIYKGGQN